jgi:hypothetical protein
MLEVLAAHGYTHPGLAGLSVARFRRWLRKFGFTSRHHTSKMVNLTDFYSPVAAFTSANLFDWSWDLVDWSDPGEAPRAFRNLVLAAHGVGSWVPLVEATDGRVAVWFDQVPSTVFQDWWGGRCAGLGLDPGAPEVFEDGLPAGLLDRTPPAGLGEPGSTAPAGGLGLGL